MINKKKPSNAGRSLRSLGYARKLARGAAWRPAAHHFILCGSASPCRRAAKITLLGIPLMLALLAGCAQVVSGDTEDILVETQPKSGAQCVLQNGRGSWALLATPASVTLLRSTTPLTVSCRTADGWSGNRTIDSTVSYLAYADAVTLVGGAVDSQSGAAFDYPERVSLILQAPAESGKPRSVFGSDGGRGIAAPLDAAADRARASDDNIATRFQTLRVLLDEGLITADEYNGRRGANIGALLRYSMIPPARDLGRPAPPPAQLVARLRYLAAAYAEHSITAAEQAAERATIMDGLLPLQSIKRADPPPPIRDSLQLAAEIGRVERLRAAMVITEKEAATERAKVTQLLDSAIAAEDAAQRAAAGVALTSPLAVSSGVGVALTTFSSEAQAKRAWAALIKAHATELSGLRLSLRKVPRPHRPSHYRITAGPVADYTTATSLCKSLARQGVTCEATSFSE